MIPNRTSLPRKMENTEVDKDKVQKTRGNSAGL